jgi:hypothetical protein
MLVLAAQNLFCQGIDCPKGTKVEVNDRMGKYLLKKGWVYEIKEAKTKK